VPKGSSKRDLVRIGDRDGWVCRICRDPARPMHRPLGTVTILAERRPTFLKSSDASRIPTGIRTAPTTESGAGNATQNRPLLPLIPDLPPSAAAHADGACAESAYHGPCASQSGHLDSAIRSARLPPVAGSRSPLPSRCHARGVSSSAHPL
jgi:hypothetical protein